MRKNTQSFFIYTAFVALLSGCWADPTPKITRPANWPTASLWPPPPAAPPQPIATPVKPPPSVDPPKTPTAGLLAAITLSHALLPLTDRLWFKPDWNQWTASPDQVIFTFAITGNAQGQLQPPASASKTDALGGFAARTAAISRLAALSPPLPAFYPISVGNDLTKHFGPLLTATDHSAAAAALILSSLADQHYAALLINSSELRLGPDALALPKQQPKDPKNPKASTKTKHTTVRLSANIAYQSAPQSPIFTPHLILNPDAPPSRRVGLTGVSRRDGLDNKLIDELKVEIQDPQTAAQAAVRALRDQKASAVVLVSGLGLMATQRLLRAWDAKLTPPPEIVLMSGSPTPNNTPDWLGESLLIEPPNADTAVLLLQLRVNAKGDLVWPEVKPQVQEQYGLRAALHDLIQTGQRLNLRTTSRVVAQLSDKFDKLPKKLSQTDTTKRLLWMRVPAPVKLADAEMQARIRALGSQKPQPQPKPKPPKKDP
jgi:hypothetical protein